MQTSDGNKCVHVLCAHKMNSDAHNYTKMSVIIYKTHMYNNKTYINLKKNIHTYIHTDIHTCVQV